MATKMKRTSVSLLPEWNNDLKKLKKEQFYDKTHSEMLRHLIKLGLLASKNSST
jgi:hypothetical protein